MNTRALPPGSRDPDYGLVVEQLVAYGLEVERLETDGVLRRVPHREDKRSRKDGWYVAHEFTTSAGRVLIAGAFGWWRDECGPYRIGAQVRGLTETDRAEFARLRKATRQAVAREREGMARQAAERAVKLWARLPEVGPSRYLQARRVHAYGVKFSRGGGLVVPVRKVTGQLAGLQFIQPDGAKRFLTGTAKRGAFHLIGTPEIGAVLAVGEGYATMASVHRATRWTCAVAFDAGNLLPVAEALSQAYPHCRMVLCGDDDYGLKTNVGRAKATEAAARVNGVALFPVFAATGAERGTDWNDLHRVVGLEAVQRQLEDGAANGAPPAPPSGGEGSYPFDLGILLRQFALIYGTETVYDGRHGMIVSLAGLRVAAGRKLVEAWLECEDRRLVMPEGVVFDPAGDADPATTVNLFRGWPLVPREGSCERLLALLHYICGESDNVFDWVVRWAAYPLQHPGAKMRTAILMHGPEGTGKNSFWGALSEIYGEHAVMIGQNELESQFNGWASKKLLIIGNEVVSRQEMYHQKGKLKSMITEPQWAVNEKMLPVRMEQNHANFVFFSNTIQPLTPDPDDRRYLVIWTPPSLAESHYTAVGEEIAAGGVQALYHYLLHYTLGDFTEHTKPIMTQAKADLIAASMDSHERFRREWERGELPVGYRPCLSMDLYAAYRRWCQLNGEKPAPQRILQMALSKHLSDDRRPWYIDPGGQRRQLRAAIPRTFAPPAGKSKEVVLGDEYRLFSEELCQWVGSG